MLLFERTSLPTYWLVRYEVELCWLSVCSIASLQPVIRLHRVMRPESPYVSNTASCSDGLGRVSIRQSLVDLHILLLRKL